MIGSNRPGRMRRRINWPWILLRIRATRCRHVWIPGDRKGHAACRDCGVWRWWPIVQRWRYDR